MTSSCAGMQLPVRCMLLHGASGALPTQMQHTHLRRDLAALLTPPLYLSHSTAPARMPVAMARLVRRLFWRRLKLGISVCRARKHTRTWRAL